MANSTSSTPTDVIIIGHRGVSGHALENTLDSFRLAVDNFVTYCDGIELDIHVTSDGAIVVHHDAALPSGEVIARTPLRVLREIPLANQSPVPTLAEVLALSDTLHVYVELKSLPESADDSLLSLVASATNPGRVHLHAFDHRLIARLMHRQPLLSCGVLSASYPLDPVAQVKDAGATTLWQEWSLIDAGLVERCHREGIGVIAWTVNERSAAKALRELGVVGLCGNWPERLRKR